MRTIQVKLKDTFWCSPVVFQITYRELRVSLNSHKKLESLRIFNSRDRYVKRKGLKLNTTVKYAESVKHWLIKRGFLKCSS